MEKLLRLLQSELCPHGLPQKRVHHPCRQVVSICTFGLVEKAMTCRPMLRFNQLHSCLMAPCGYAKAHLQCHGFQAQFYTSHNYPLIYRLSRYTSIQLAI